MRSPFPLMNVSAGLLVLGLLTAGLTLRSAAADEVVGRFSNDWTGNGLQVQAIEDPGVKGVTCHLVDFDRSLIDRLSKGNWFEDPSNASIACRQTGPVTVGDIELSQKGRRSSPNGKA
ncbi:CreA family protein [Azospirillum sp. INR13]|uniref:CreA family protein n=1 Tax=Azospirillum sp. INR13 TaxID=2596919 RepID=UPI00351C0079